MNYWHTRNEHGKVCFCLRYSTPFFEMVSAEHFFWGGGVYYPGLQNCLCKSTTHHMTICKYRYLLWVCNGVARTNSRHFAFGVSIVLCMICPQRLQLLTVLGYLLFLVAVNPQLHLFEICLLIDKDIENDSIFGENVLQELEDRARSLKAFRYIVYWM